MNKKLDQFLKENIGTPPSAPADEYSKILSKTQIVKRPFWKTPQLWVPVGVAACVTLLVLQIQTPSNGSEDQLEAFLDDSFSVVSENSDDFDF